MEGLFSFCVSLVIWLRPGIGLVKKEAILFWLWLWTWATSLGPELKAAWAGGVYPVISSCSYILWHASLCDSPVVTFPVSKADLWRDRNDSSCLLFEKKKKKKDAAEVQRESQSSQLAWEPESADQLGPCNVRQVHLPLGHSDRTLGPDKTSWKRLLIL